MSRLDSFIRRMCAQRDILNGLPEHLVSVKGAVLEFGLGSGRTYDHLRECFPERRLVVFERDVRDDYMPEPAPKELVVGDIQDTAASFPDGCAALIHADINTGLPEADASMLTWLAPLVVRLTVPGGIVVSSIGLTHPRLAPMRLPASVSEGRYFVHQRLP